MYLKLWCNQLINSTSVLYIHQLSWNTMIFPFYLSFLLGRLALQNSQILNSPIRGLEEKLHTHMSKWCFHGYNWLNLVFANLPSVCGKTHCTFPMIWVLRYRQCLPMQWMQSQECRTREKCIQLVIWCTVAMCVLVILIRVGNFVGVRNIRQE